MSEPMEERKMHPVYDYVDKPCIPLLDAINSIDGLVTTYSCCGHGRYVFQVSIAPTDVNKFSSLIDIINRLHHSGQIGKWEISLRSRGGIPENVSYWLLSDSKGQKAYEEADLIASTIMKNLEPIGSDKSFDEWWNNH